MSLMNEAYELGRPFTRHLMLHFETDLQARGIVDQFMLGENILVAPVFKPDISDRQVYLPGPAQWTHLWTGELIKVGSGISIAVNCELGFPPVFYRDTAHY
jgi:alpha-glucosidase (family GH31 glycosyl hydrolase)